MKLIATILISFIGLSFFLPQTHAQSITYKITPRIIDKEVEPRDIFQETITIENFAGHKVTVYASVNEVSIDDGGDITDFSPPSMSDNKVTVTSWLSISRAGLELLPGQSTDIPLTIKINPNAEAGEYHAFIGFGTGRNRDIAEKMVRDGRAPGVIITLRIDQKQIEFLKLGKFIIDKFITNSENSAVSYALINSGAATVVPTGEIIISNSKGNEAGSISVNPNKDELLAGQSTEYTAAVPTDGLFGKYKAFLSVDYGTQQPASIQDTTFFYVIPWKKLLILLIILLFAAVIITVYLNRRHTSHDDEEHGAEYVALHIQEGTSEDKDHDINLK